MEPAKPAVAVYDGPEGMKNVELRRFTRWEDVDIAGLASLEGVIGLGFQDCRLPDVSPATSLPFTASVKHFGIYNSMIDSFDGIDDLPNLEIFGIYNSNFKGFPGKARHEHVEELRINNCPLETLVGMPASPALFDLHLDNTAISSFEGLEGCPDVKTISARFCTSLGSLRGLQNARKLKKLDLTMHGVEFGGNIREPGRLTSLHGLEHCESLVEIDVTGHRIEGLDGLGNCTRLVKVIARHNRIASTRGVEGCKALENLGLAYNRIGRVEGFGGLTRLRGLSLNDNPLVDIAGLAPLARTLKYVNIGNSGVSSLDVFRSFALESLSCENCEVTSLEPLREMATLKKLSVSGSPVESLEPVEGLKELRKLHAAGCGLTEAHVPASHIINELVLRDNAITAFSLPPHVRRLFMVDTEPAIDLSGNPLSSFSIDEWFSTNGEPCVIALASTVPITTFVWPSNEDAPRFGLEVFRAWEVDDPRALEARMRWLFPNETNKDDLAQVRMWVFWRDDR